MLRHSPKQDRPITRSVSTNAAEQRKEAEDNEVIEEAVEGEVHDEMDENTGNAVLDAREEGQISMAQVQQIASETVAASTIEIYKMLGSMKIELANTFKSMISEVISGGDKFENEIQEQQVVVESEVTQTANKTGAYPKTTVVNRKSGGVSGDEEARNQRLYNDEANSKWAFPKTQKTAGRSNQKVVETESWGGVDNHIKKHSEPPKKNSQINYLDFLTQGYLGNNESYNEISDHHTLYAPRSTFSAPIGPDPTIQTVTNERQASNDAKLVKTWGIKFTGEKHGMPVGDFLFRIETHRQRHRMTWKQIVENFHIMVEGRADAFYWQMYRYNYNRGLALTWDTLKGAFIKQFQPNASEFEVMRELMSVKQGRDEGFDSLYSRFFRIHNQLDTPLREAAIVEMLRNSLREEMDQLTFAAEIDSVDQLRNLVLRAETRAMTRRSHVGITGRRVSEIVGDDETTEQRQTQRRNPKDNWVCWNCDQRGHGYMRCEQDRTIFCYRCGRKNVTLPRCPKCGQGNRNASGNRTGQFLLQTPSPANQG